MAEKSEITPEHQILRDIWTQLAKEGLKQTQVSERLKSLKARLGEEAIADVSASYLSQMLVRPKTLPESGEKQPTTARLRSVTLALAELVDQHRSELSTDRLNTVTALLEQAMATLQVELPLWQDGEAPLAANAVNLIERDADRAVDDYLAQFNRPFVLTVFGGPRCGKTTLLNRTQAKARRLGYRVLYADLAREFVEAGDDPAIFWSSLGQGFELPGPTPDARTFAEALMETLAQDPSRVLLLLDGANVLIDQPGDSWGEHAIGSLTRFLVQPQRMAPPGSPAKRLCIITAGTFSHLYLPAPSLNSLRTLQDRSITIDPLGPAEVRELVRLHIDHANERPGAHVPSDLTTVDFLTTEVAEWFGGQPMLTQDFLSEWVRNPSLTNLRERLETPTDLAERFVSILADQVQPRGGSRVLLVRPTADASAADAAEVIADPDALRVMQLLDSGAWTAPYLARWLSPRLTAKGVE